MESRRGLFVVKHKTSAPHSAMNGRGADCGSGTTLCIDMGGTRAKVGVFDGTDLVAFRDVRLEGVVSDLERTRAAAAELMAAAAQPVTRAAIALPGIVDIDRGCLVSVHGKYEYAADLNFRSWAQDSFGVPTIIEQDARAALFGESTVGVAQGLRDVVVLALGTGIGTAAIVDGTMLRGSTGHAGVLGGHMTVQLDGPDCVCGNRGCAEALASTWAYGRDTGGRGLRELVGSEDPRDRYRLNHYCEVWAATLVSVCHSFDPEAVVVTGGVMRAHLQLMPPIESYLDAHLWPSLRRPLLLVPDAPERSVLLGLAALGGQWE